MEDIFDLCDLDDNGTMSKDEFNWFNVRTSGEELGDDEWEVVNGEFCRLLSVLLLIRQILGCET